MNSRFVKLGLLFVVVFLASYSAAVPNVIPEVRGVFVHPDQHFSKDPETGKAQISDLVAALSRANFNCIFAWVTSDYMSALAGPYDREKGSTPWDFLGELISQARAKGLDVHLWYSFTFYKQKTSPDFDPSRNGDPSWAARRLDEFVPNPKTGQIVPRRMADVCPLHPGAREWEVAFIERMLQRYPMATGLHIEEPGYGYSENCVCDLCLDVFKLVYGQDLTTRLSSPEAVDLKCMGTTDCIRSLKERLAYEKERKLPFSVNGSSSWAGDRRLGRDWMRWSQFGWLDFYVAQIYQCDVPQFRTAADRVIRDMSRNCGVVVALPAHNCQSDTIIEQINAVRQLGGKGVALFHAQSLKPELLEALSAGPFREPAVVPPFASSNLQTKD